MRASMTNVKPSMANATAPGSGISVRTPSTSQPAIRNARPAWKTSREPICFATRPASTNRPMPPACKQLAGAAHGRFVAYVFDEPLP